MHSQFTSYEQLPITLTADHVAAALGRLSGIRLRRTAKTKTENQHQYRLDLLNGWFLDESLSSKHSFSIMNFHF